MLFPSVTSSGTQVEMSFGFCSEQPDTPEVVEQVNKMPGRAVSPKDIPIKPNTAVLIRHGSDYYAVIVGDAQPRPVGDDTWLSGIWYKMPEKGGFNCVQTGVDEGVKTPVPFSQDDIERILEGGFYLCNKDGVAAEKGRCTTFPDLLPSRRYLRLQRCLNGMSKVPTIP